MAVIRLELDVDSDVYPELYARLRAITRPESRAERVRQLAAQGLVWEVVRMHGPAASADPPRAQPGQRAAPRPLPAPKPTAAVQAVPVLVDVVSEAGEDSPPLPPPLASEVQPSGPRSSRLKRMADRGLFRNG